jgi:hypothetical protein
MEKKLDVNIPIGIGDLITYRGLLDNLLPFYEVINVNLCMTILDVYKPDNKNENTIFLQNIANLVFNNEKYKVGLVYNIEHIPPDIFAKHHNLQYKIPNLRNELCNDDKIIDGEYIVLATKARFIDRELFLSRKETFCSVLNDLSKKYKVVLVGEKIVEMNKEYQHHGSHYIFSIYNDIIDSLKNNIINLTVPALGITIPNIENLKKDCSIMSHAKKVITFGVGGNFSIAQTVSNAIAYKEGGALDFLFTNHVNNDSYFITKEWYEFINVLLKL